MASASNNGDGEGEKSTLMMFFTPQLAVYFIGAWLSVKGCFEGVVIDNVLQRVDVLVLFRELWLVH